MPLQISYFSRYIDRIIFLHLLLVAQHFKQAKDFIPQA